MLLSWAGLLLGVWCCASLRHLPWGNSRALLHSRAVVLVDRIVLYHTYYLLYHRSYYINYLIQYLLFYKVIYFLLYCFWGAVWDGLLLWFMYMLICMFVSMLVGMLVCMFVCWCVCLYVILCMLCCGRGVFCWGALFSSFKLCHSMVNGLNWLKQYLQQPNPTCHLFQSCLLAPTIWTTDL